MALVTPICKTLMLGGNRAGAEEFLVSEVPIADRGRDTSQHGENEENGAEKSEAVKLPKIVEIPAVSLREFFLRSLRGGHGESYEKIRCAVTSLTRACVGLGACRY